MIKAPGGICLYLRTLSRDTHGTPEEAAAKAAAHGVSAVAIMAAWQDGPGGSQTRTPNTDTGTLDSYARAYCSRGIDVWLWAFPWPGGERILADVLCKAGEGLDIKGWLLDPEVPFKYRSKVKSMEDQPEAISHSPRLGKRAVTTAARALMTLCRRETLRRGIGLAVTSYGMADWHRNFPWKSFLQPYLTFASPQLYRHPSIWRKGYAAWERLAPGVPIVPSLPAFGPEAGRNLGRTIDKHRSLGARGLFIWSTKQLNGGEWDVIHDKANR